MALDLIALLSMAALGVVLMMLARKVEKSWQSALLVVTGLFFLLPVAAILALLALGVQTMQM